MVKLLYAQLCIKFMFFLIGFSQLAAVEILFNVKHQIFVIMFPWKLGYPGCDVLDKFIISENPVDWMISVKLEYLITCSTVIRSHA